MTLPPNVNTPLLFRQTTATSPRVLTPTQYVWTDPATLPRRQWLYHPGYIRQFLSATVATGGAGKSSLIVVEALSMVSGRALLGVQPESTLRVWYWNGEDPHDELRRRVGAAQKFYNISPDDIGDRLFIDSGREQPIIIATQLRGGTTVAIPVVNQVIEALQANNIDVMVIDPFISSHEIPENDNTSVKMVAKCWAEIAEHANCAVMIVHHTRKTNGQTADVDAGRGGSALADAARSVRVINTMSLEEAKLADIDANLRRWFFRADNGKANMTPPAEHADWYQLQSVDLGNGPDFDEQEMQQFSGTLGDKVGTVTRWRYPTGLRPTVTDEDVIMVQSLVELRGPFRKDARTTGGWVGSVFAEVFGLDLNLERDKTIIKTMIKEWIGNNRLAKAEQRHGRDSRDHTYIVVGTVRPGQEAPF